MSEVKGYLAHEKDPPTPQDHHRAQGIVLVKGPSRALIFMSVVLLYVGEAGRASSPLAPFTLNVEIGCVPSRVIPAEQLNGGLKSLCNSQFPHTSVNLFFIFVIVKDKLTALWGG